MDLIKIEGVIEAVLFAAGDAVNIRGLAEAIGCDENTTKEIINTMNDKYESAMRGFFIKRLENSYQLCTSARYSDNIRKCLKLEKPQKLTPSLLETLAIIVYMQPVTKQQIMEIRGVDAGHAVNRLIEKNLICEMGRLDAPGKPILFGTTDEFLRKFGFSGIDELPETMMRLEETLKVEEGLDSIDQVKDTVSENILI